MTRAVNPSHARQEREQRAERHRARQLLKTEAGTLQWIREAQRELDLWLDGVPAAAVAAAAAELDLPSLVRDAVGRREAPSALAARVWSLVDDRLRAARARRPPCSSCGHRAGAHGVLAWCYECKRECHYDDVDDVDRSSAAGSASGGLSLAGISIAR